MTKDWAEQKTKFSPLQTKRIIPIVACYCVWQSVMFLEGELWVRVMVQWLDYLAVT